MTTMEEMMNERGISVWEDPHWNLNMGTPRWLAGTDISASVTNVTQGCETCGFGAEADAEIEAQFTASGDTPSAAVQECYEKLTGKRQA